MKYRKKPVVIEAVQYTGTDKSKIKIWHFCNGKQIYIDENENYVIPTLEGLRLANVGDYIIKGVAGEIYPCKPEIFEQTYEKVEESQCTD